MQQSGEKIQQPQLRSRQQTPLRVGRRDFLKRLALGAAAARTVPMRASQAAGVDQNEAFLEALGKDRRLIVHNVRPGVIETPIDLLREHRLTPKELMFIRNNQVLPGSLTIKPHPAVDWPLEIGGLVSPPETIMLEELYKHEQIEIEAVLQCSGNGRSFYARSVKTRGTQWARGGMGNARWKGVPLKKVIESFGLEISPKARFLTAEGKDPPVTPTADDFEHSVPLRDIYETALLATEMNGEPIPAVHGGPLRLIVPGFYGTMNIKWLSRLRFEDRESQSHHHISRYRTFIEPLRPGDGPDMTPEATVPTWRQRIKSVIWRPVEGETLRSGPVEVSGVAWNDGRTEIASVEVSVDHGRNWRAAQLERASSAYAWHHWKSSVEVSHGDHEIWARAIDAFGQGQPLDGSVHWNPSGYEWYGVDRVRVAAT